MQIAPDDEIVEFDVDDTNIRFEATDQFERPIPQRSIGIRAHHAMRIADERVVFEVGRQKSHRLDLNLGCGGLTLSANLDFTS